MMYIISKFGEIRYSSRNWLEIRQVTSYGVRHFFQSPLLSSSSQAIALVRSEIPTGCHRCSSVSSNLDAFKVQTQFPSYILKFKRTPAVQGLQLKRKSSITRLPHLLESDPRRPPAHVMQRGHGEERAVRQCRHEQPLIPDVSVGRQSPKVHLDVRRGVDDDGVWEGKKIGNQLNIPGVRERGLIDPHVAVEHALKVPHEPVDQYSLRGRQDHASPPSVVVVDYRSESRGMSARLGWSNRHRYCGSPICA